jgi:polyphosphate kinase
MQEDFKKIIKANFRLSNFEMIPGARYHNFNDFFKFPYPFEDTSVFAEKLPSLGHPVLEFENSIIDVIQQQDVVLHYPYQKFQYVSDLLEEAALHQEVASIKMTLYRASSQSRILRTLMKAAKMGKEVLVFIELKARFDEQSNLEWGEKLKEVGATVLYSYPGIKVHSKVMYIGFKSQAGFNDIVYVSTGNFNEKTARIYCDHGLMSCEKSLSKEIHQLFDVILRKIIIPKPEEIMISPFNTRGKLSRLIEKEIDYAKSGQKAYIILKLNNLEDPAMIEKLYEASREGVQIQLIIRSICCLRPGVPDMSDNIEAFSIVDRFLEHGRLYVFGNGGEEKMFMGSADWMSRNLDARIELCVPVNDNKVYRELRHILEIQLTDHTKARMITPLLNNPYRKSKEGEPNTRSQVGIYRFLEEKFESASRRQ